MSQAKVDRYKEEKKNRAAIMKREKRRTVISGILSLAVVFALAAWIGQSAYNAVRNANEKNGSFPIYTADTSVIDDYLESLP